MRKILAMLMAIVLLAGVFAPVCFADDAAEEPTYKEGVTVVADPSSPTGFYVTFVYRNATANSVALSGSKFQFGSADGTRTNVSLANWTPDLYPVGGGTPRMAMTKVTEDLWAITIALPSGAYPYYYVLNNNTRNQIVDPVNPPVKHSITGNVCKFSMAYVPFDSSKQLIDRSVENPRTDGKTGTLEFKTYDDNGTTRPLAIYLPYGYDKDREEPYKVFYLSHGGGGMELEWMNEGCVPNIVDNLVAEGKVEPFIVVTMNNTVFNWNYPEIMRNQFDNIIPFIEANYNVLKDASGRAYAGLSMGGVTTENMYRYHANDIGYFGIWSAADAGTPLTGIENLDKPIVMLGGGVWDIGYVYFDDDSTTRNTIYDIRRLMDNENYTYFNYAVPGSHDWAVWPELFAYFAENVLWRPAVTVASVDAECGEGKTAAVNVSIKGIDKVSSIRLKIDSDLPIASITSEYDFEYNPANNKVVVYSVNGSNLDTSKLFTINYDLDVEPWYADGKHEIDISEIEVTNVDGEIISVSGMSGRVIIKNNYPQGDIDMSGKVTNADIIAIARYLVDLVKFTPAQIAIADADDNGVVNNTDLVMVARRIVTK